MKYPKTIEPCPIVEAIIELRYDSDFPGDAVFGSIYALLDLKKDFPRVEQQPITQIPEAVRNQDENLRYQTCYVLTKDDALQLRIGPHSIVFACINRYVGWDAFFAFASDYVRKLLKNNIFKRIERIGLRYVNLFQFSVLPKTNLKVSMPSGEIIGDSLTMRIEKKDTHFAKIVQVSNAVGIQSPSFKGTGSLIDIDCISPNLITPPFDEKSILDTIDTMHSREKEEFFRLLTTEFITSLNPKYGEESK
jgi:uncharacterized protein (TIGR04255 family)